MNKEKLIEEKQAQIKRLQAELNELKDPHSIKTFMTEKMLGLHWMNDPKKPSYSGNYVKTEGWEDIRKTCMDIHRGHYKNQKVTIKALSKDEVKLSARMADEMVRIWNKYMQEVYGECE